MVKSVISVFTVEDRIIFRISYPVWVNYLPDNSDDKILECAIAGRCNTIVTFNTRDFPKNILDQYNLLTITPGEFIKSGGLKCSYI